MLAAVQHSVEILVGSLLVANNFIDGTHPANFYPLADCLPRNPTGSSSFLQHSEDFLKTNPQINNLLTFTQCRHLITLVSQVVAMGLCNRTLQVDQWERETGDRWTESLNNSAQTEARAVCWRWPSICYWLRVVSATQQQPDSKSSPRETNLGWKLLLVVTGGFTESERDTECNRMFYYFCWFTWNTVWDFVCTWRRISEFKRLIFLWFILCDTRLHWMNSRVTMWVIGGSWEYLKGAMDRRPVQRGICCHSNGREDLSQFRVFIWRFL